MGVLLAIWFGAFVLIAMLLVKARTVAVRSALAPLADGRGGVRSGRVTGADGDQPVASMLSDSGCLGLTIDVWRDAGDISTLELRRCRFGPLVVESSDTDGEAATAQPDALLPTTAPDSTWSAADGPAPPALAALLADARLTDTSGLRAREWRLLSGTDVQVVRHPDMGYTALVPSDAEALQAAAARELRGWTIGLAIGGAIYLAWPIAILSLLRSSLFR